MIGRVTVPHLDGTSSRVGRIRVEGEASIRQERDAICPDLLHDDGAADGQVDLYRAGRVQQRGVERRRGARLDLDLCEAGAQAEVGDEGSQVDEALHVAERGDPAPQSAPGWAAEPAAGTVPVTGAGHVWVVGTHVYGLAAHAVPGWGRDDLGVQGAEGGKRRARRRRGRWEQHVAGWTDLRRVGARLARGERLLELEDVDRRGGAAHREVEREDDVAVEPRLAEGCAVGVATAPLRALVELEVRVHVAVDIQPGQVGEQEQVILLLILRIGCARPRPTVGIGLAELPRIAARTAAADLVVEGALADLGVEVDLGQVALLGTAPICDDPCGRRVDAARPVRTGARAVPGATGEGVPAAGAEGVQVGAVRAPLTGNTRIKAAERAGGDGALLLAPLREAIRVVEVPLASVAHEEAGPGDIRRAHREGPGLGARAVGVPRGLDVSGAHCGVDHRPVQVRGTGLPAGAGRTPTGVAVEWAADAYARGSAAGPRRWASRTDSCVPGEAARVRYDIAIHLESRHVEADEAVPLRNNEGIGNPGAGRQEHESEGKGNQVSSSTNQRFDQSRAHSICSFSEIRAPRAPGRCRCKTARQGVRPPRR